MADPKANKKTNWCVTQSRTTSISFEWQIRNFSLHITSAGSSLTSSTFTSDEDDGVTWFVKAFPKGTCVQTSGYLALRLYSASKKTEDKTAKFKMSIIKCGNTKYKELEATVEIRDQRELYNGWAEFIKTETILDENNGLLQNDTLTISCEIKYLVTSYNISGKIPKVVISESQLSDDMYALFEKELFTDVVLMANEKEFKVHKGILAARSPVFAAMLSNDMKEKNENVIKISDMDDEVMHDMLDFIYTGERPELTSTASTQKLLAAADKYDLSTLRIICEKELVDNLTTDNAAELLILAYLHNANQLKTAALDFVFKNNSTITSESTWLDSMRDHPSLLNEVLVHHIQCHQTQNEDS